MLKIIILIVCLTISTVANAANYYVLPSASGNGSSWASAWNGFGAISWGSIAAGDTIYVGGGTYTGTMTIGASGTEAAKITIKKATTADHGTSTGWSDSYNNAAYFNATSGGKAITISGRHDLVIDGKSAFYIKGDDTRRPTHAVYGYGTGTYRVAIKGLIIEGMRYAGIHLQSGEGGFEIADNDIGKCGYETAHDRDGCIVYLYMGTATYGRSSIHNNYLHDGGYVENAYATDLLTGAIDKVDIYENHFYSGWCLRSSSDMIHINGDYNIITSNIFEGTSAGVNQNIFFHTNNPASENPKNNTVKGNIFYKPMTYTTNGAISFAAYDGGNISGTVIENNTFYGHKWSIYFNRTGTGSITGTSIRSNIFWPHDTDHRSIYDNASVYTNLVLDYNLHYHTSPYYSSSGYKTLTQLQNDGKETHGIVGDPLFVTPGSDFHLQVGSPAIDAGLGGVDMGAYGYADVTPDTTAPIITQSSLSGTVDCTSDPMIVIETANSDEASILRWHATSVTYDNMTGSWDTTGGTTHVKTTSRACGASYQFYMAGINAAGLKSDPVLFSYTIEAAVPDPVIFISGTKYGLNNACTVQGTTLDLYNSVYNPDLNFATATNGFLRTNPEDTAGRVIYYKTDLSSIPTNATVTDAEIYFYQTEAGGDATLEISAHQITGTAFTSSSTWNTYTYSSHIAAAESLEEAASTNGWRKWNIATMVAAWVADPATNKGLALLTDQGATHATLDTYRGFALSENADATTRPFIVVAYTVPSPSDKTISGSGTLTLTPGGGGTLTFSW